MGEKHNPLFAIKGAKMTGQTQIQKVMQTLLDKGQISRNECLRNYISRLGAIIFFLKEQGWDIQGDYKVTKQGKSYVPFFLIFLILVRIL